MRRTTSAIVVAPCVPWQRSSELDWGDLADAVEAPPEASGSATPAGLDGPVGNLRPMSELPSTQRPSPASERAFESSGVTGWTQISNRLLDDRIVFLGDELDDQLANVVCAQMLYLEGQDRGRDISLYINSPGGSVTAGMAIYDTMQFVACDVATVCLGLGASMGQFLLTAGAPGKRYCLPHARVMMHQPSGGVRGQASDIAIQAEQMAYVKRLMAERTALHSGQDVEQILLDSERDRWFTAEEAKGYGLCDHVVVKRGEMI